jgi:hypothetical protein
MSYIKPQITPPSPLKVAAQNGGPEWRVNLADLGSPRGKPARRLHEVWFGSFSQWLYSSFLMISPNLHDIWAMFFLILSRCETLHFLIVIRT